MRYCADMSESLEEQEDDTSFSSPRTVAAGEVTQGTEPPVPEVVQTEQTTQPSQELQSSSSHLLPVSRGLKRVSRPPDRYDPGLFSLHCSCPYCMTYSCELYVSS